MASYLNPQAFMPKNDFVASGMLGGALAAHGLQQSDAITEQALKEGELDRQLKEIKVKEDAGLLDSKLAKAAYEEAKAKFDKGEYDNGNMRTMTDSKNATTLSDESLKRTQDDVAQKTAAAPLWQQMSAELKQMGGQLDWGNQEHRDWYDGWRQKMQKYAPNMPAFPGPADTQKIMMQGDTAARFIQAKGAGANVKHDQAMEQAAVAPTIHGQTQRDVEDVRSASNERIAAGHDDARVEAANARAEVARYAKKESERATMTLERLNQKGALKANDGDVEFNVKQAEEAAITAAKADLEADFLGYGVLAKSNDPEKRAKADKMLQDLVIKKLQGVKDYEKAKALVSGSPKTVTNEAPAAPTSKQIPTISDAAAYGALKSGDTYVDARTGKTMVKK